MSFARAHRAVVAGALVTVLVGSVLDGIAAADTAGGDVPAVDILPLHSSSHGPNEGTWFVFRLSPGTTARGTAQLINPAQVAQRVAVYPRALDFTDTGTPVVSANPRAGMAPWVSLARASVVVPAGGRVDVGYTVRVPSVVAPGDHTAVLVAASTPQSSGVTGMLVEKRIATRFYVTVPGKIRVGFSMTGPVTTVDNPLWPGGVDATVTLRNTGNVGFAPDVRVDGAPASGSTTVLSHSVEVYHARVHVPWYGGPVHVDVVATANGAHRQAVSKTVWVIPWALVAIALVVLVGLVHAVSFARRRWRRWRAEQQALREQLAALQADRARAHAGVPAQRDAAATPEPLDDRVALDAEG